MSSLHVSPSPKSTGLWFTPESLPHLHSFSPWDHVCRHHSPTVRARDSLTLTLVHHTVSTFQPSVHLTSCPPFIHPLLQTGEQKQRWGIVPTQHESWSEGKRCLWKRLREWGQKLRYCITREEPRWKHGQVIGMRHREQWRGKFEFSLSNQIWLLQNVDRRGPH